MGILMKNGVPYASGSEIPEGGTKGQVLAKASNISGDFEWVNGGGEGNATFDVATIPQGPTSAHEINAVVSNADSENARLSYVRQSDGTLPNTVNLGVMSGLGDDSFELPTKGYVDSAVTDKTLAPSGWGVVRTGVATVTFNNSKWSSSAMVDVSEFGFSSEADYDVVAQPTTGGTATPWGNAIAYVNADKGASLFSVSSFTMEESLSGTVNIKYTIFAKGYGAVAYTGEIPTGGTAGQILTKRSDADGDYGWGTGGGSGTHFEVGAEKWYGTYTEGGVTYQVYSKLINIGALPSAAGATQYPHGITGIKQILQISGFTNDGFVMNAPRQNSQDNISIYQAQKAGNIVVEVGKDRSGKTGFVMMIYAKNN